MHTKVTNSHWIASGALKVSHLTEESIQSKGYHYQFITLSNKICTTDK